VFFDILFYTIGNTIYCIFKNFAYYFILLGISFFVYKFNNYNCKGIQTSDCRIQLPFLFDIFSYTIGNIIFCIFKNFELNLINIAARLYKHRLAEANFLSCLYFILYFYQFCRYYMHLFFLFIHHTPHFHYIIILFLTNCSKQIVFFSFRFFLSHLGSFFLPAEGSGFACYNIALMVVK